MIGFGYGWVVECGIYKVINVIVVVFLFYNCLFDVNDFRGMFIEVMYIKNFFGINME